MQITDPLLTKKEAAAILKISVPTFYRRVADGTVPRPIKIGSLSKWPLSDILSTIEEAKSARAPQPFRGAPL
ncbi:DNA-binding protein [Rhizobium laguerreae]|uniref:DNA-binding protein n=1 Tax=Rhizobium changzhiense TaxID=2692317 RepID=A0ABR6A6I7_9HYPH|nr:MULTISPECIES: helix-turn-helix domain-containing protein [Rhizobium]MBA5802158.1 DNA-binding protein [Rhizobium changzhiense]MBY3524952.1 DNA-binding protein [Rhizobium laguerreae]NNU47149.1 DNA-binding protein [Rhizobium changzhiense]